MTDDTPTGDDMTKLLEQQNTSDAPDPELDTEEQQ